MFVHGVGEQLYLHWILILGQMKGHWLKCSCTREDNFLFGNMWCNRTNIKL